MKNLLFAFFCCFLFSGVSFGQEPVDKSNLGRLPTDSSSFVKDAGLQPVTSSFTSHYDTFSQPTGNESDRDAVIDTHVRVPEMQTGGKTDVAGTAAGSTVAPHSPYANDFSQGGTISSWQNGFITGESSRVTMPGLMSTQNAYIGVVQRMGNFTFSGGLSADRYLLSRGIKTQFGISGSLTYDFNDNFSATVFGQYYTNQSFYSMAAMPYFGRSAFGGYLTFMGSRVGLSLGVERYYDAFSGRWVTSPIVTPRVKFSEKFVVDIPVGEYLKTFVDNKFFGGGRKGNPTIMPGNMHSISPVPFGSPDIPYQK